MFQRLERRRWRRRRNLVRRSRHKVIFGNALKQLRRPFLVDGRCRYRTLSSRPLRRRRRPSGNRVFHRARIRRILDERTRAIVVREEREPPFLRFVRRGAVRRERGGYRGCSRRWETWAGAARAIWRRRAGLLEKHLFEWIPHGRQPGRHRRRLALALPALRHARQSISQRLRHRPTVSISLHGCVVTIAGILVENVDSAWRRKDLERRDSRTRHPEGLGGCCWSKVWMARPGLDCTFTGESTGAGTFPTSRAYWWYPIPVSDSPIRRS